jgi:hypothetical protein
MLGVTFFGLFLTPVFYVLLHRRRKPLPATQGISPAPAGAD